MLFLLALLPDPQSWTFGAICVTCSNSPVLAVQLKAIYDDNLRNSTGVSPAYRTQVEVSTCPQCYTICKIAEFLTSTHACVTNISQLTCSDITNDQLGISDETGHGGANLYIY